MRLALFVLFVAALVLLKGYLGGQWRAGEQRARAVLGEPAGGAAPGAGEETANPRPQP